MKQNQSSENLFHSCNKSDSQKLLDILFSSTSEKIVLTDEAWKICMASNPFFEVLGLPPNKVLYTPLENFIDKKTCDFPMNELVRESPITSLRNNDGRKLEVTMEDLSSTEQVSNFHLIRFSESSINTKQQDMFFSSVPDVSLNISEAIYSKLELSELMDEILEQISKIIEFDSASISLLEEDFFHIVAHKGFIKPDNVIDLKFPVKLPDNDYSPNYVAISNRKSVRMGNVPAEYPFFVHPPDITIRSWMTIPLLTKAGGIGTLNLDSYSENSFGEKDQTVAEIFAAQVSIAIENAVKYEDTSDEAKIDSLTGLYRRGHFERLAELEIILYNPKLYPICFAMFDIDIFKTFNDTYGHHAGDQILKSIADLCVHGLRKNDLVSRYGGDEFVIIMPDVELMEAKIAVNRLCDLIAHHRFLVDKKELQITASFGLTNFTLGDSIKTVIQRADKALYKAKEHGKNQVFTFEFDEKPENKLHGTGDIL